MGMQPTSSISQKKIKQIAAKIARDYKPEKIILFGSHAWGKPNPDSDVDLLVIKHTKNARDLSRKIDGSIFPRPFPIDLLVLTPSQVEQRKKTGDFFIEDIINKGRVLYAG